MLVSSEIGQTRHLMKHKDVVNAV